jgi:hypothetical protein
MGVEFCKNSISKIISYIKKMKKYSIWKGFYKALINVAIFAIPFLLTQYPTVANLTIGGLGYMLVNFLKVKFSK